MNEAQRRQFFEIRRLLDNLVDKIVDNPAEINDSPAAIRTWSPGSFVAGEVRQYEGIPYKCVQDHDSTGNEAWTPAATPALWMQYHGTSIETARPWIAPTGAHDMYKAGEYIIWNDDTVRICKADTVYSPADYDAAWEVVT